MMSAIEQIASSRRTSVPSPAAALVKVAGEIKRTPEKPTRYTVRGLGEIARLTLPPREDVWNGIEINAGAVVEIVGSPSIGKSRLVSDLARHQILGRPFGGRKTLGRPLKWLLLGSENGLRRQHMEARSFLFGTTEIDGKSYDELSRLAKERGFSSADLDLLDRNFRTMTLEDPADSFISVGDPENVIKLKATLNDERPDIVVFDPWGDTIAGSELDDADVRATVRAIREIEREAGIPYALTVIINHARIGAKEEASARGLSEGAFGKNSKCLYSIARIVFNIRRASFDDNPPIEVVCAKNNDGKKPSPIAFELDAESMSYRHLADFDHDAWQAELEKAAGLTKAEKRGGITQEEKAALWENVKNILAKADGGVLKSGDLIAALRNQGVGKSAAENFITACVCVGHSLARTPMMKESRAGGWTRAGNAVVVGFPATVEEYQRTHQ